jgi:ribonuclease HII
MPPTTDEELALLAGGARWIAGIDEAGRGCWAGPVVAAAVVLDPAILADPRALAGVDDSKTLSAARRALFFERIVACSIGWGIGVVPAHVIDTHGILPATRVAMQIALLCLPQLPDALLIDAVHLADWPCPQKALIRGDSRCLSIAAASVLAKVTRDRLLEQLSLGYPAYGFASHKGYGTLIHEQALRAYGPCELHRRTFRPLADLLTNGSWPTNKRHGSATIRPARNQSDGSNGDDDDD